MAVAILVFAAVKGLQRLWWGVRHSAVGLAADVIRAAVGQEGELPPEPRSLQNGDSIYGPQIQRDFTGFNIARAKELAEGAVRRDCLLYKSSRRAFRQYQQNRQRGPWGQ